jgi:hypothetical protein
MTRNRKILTMVFAVLVGLMVLIILLGRTVKAVEPIKYWLDTHPQVYLGLLAAYWIGHLATRQRSGKD